MTEDEYILAGLLVVLVVLVGRLLAPRLRLPDAIVLVPLGFAVSFLPGMREVHVSPEVVLLVFLPPLIYNAAFFSSPREMRAEARPIVALAVGMTLVTALAVAVATFVLLPHTDWPAAIALGAAVAPTDAVAASAVLRRVGAPRRVVTILEGESLINDGVALTMFGLAVTAMTTPLTFGDGVLELVKVVLGGVAFGLLVAKLVMWSRSRLHDGNTQLVVSLVTPFVAYIPAELMGFSGVLSAVVAGFLLGTRGEGILPPRVRVTGRTVWQGLVMLLESVLFVLLGLQMHEVLDDVAGRPLGELAVTSVAVIGTAVVVRLVWEIAVTPVMRLLPGRLRLDPGPVRHRAIIGWSGMRGAISLAIALSLPLTIGTAPFEDRNVLIFLAAAVVLATLIGQGMTLPLVLRRLRVTQDSRARHEIALAEVAMGRAALTRIDELLADDQVDSLAAETYRQMYKLRVRQSRATLDMTGGDHSALHHVKGTVFLRHELGTAKRAALARLYRKGEISHEVFQALQRELDLQEPHRPH
ncbi:Na+/H+ antiporter [Marinitenerispora sediminis]|uniref:Na+/H+ antiporter n=1 Tax=Marinitenerispora sediminis TaxID=1931232 RepID=A0A368T9D6_9ACTN|nr:Na+/H+ antiporter [Marinitenerispora sediminis]RCV55675.1 Na+/H+ antiporter [Marinitenerispora sediminis]RCV57727.1 Na+/H+ antiporter [Marinitenerispora sediminis]RCV60899.1 Na+/H+ antiporter [Marinitenerispora sediminis]